MIIVTLYKHPIKERYSGASLREHGLSVGTETALAIATELGRSNYSDPEEAKRVALDVLTASGVPEKEVYVNFRDRNLE